MAVEAFSRFVSIQFFAILTSFPVRRPGLVLPVRIPLGQVPSIHILRRRRYAYLSADVSIFFRRFNQSLSSSSAWVS